MMVTYGAAGKCVVIVRHLRRCLEFKGTRTGRLQHRLNLSKHLKIGGDGAATD